MKLQIDFSVERRLGDPLIKIIVDDYLTLADGAAQDHYEFDCNIPNDTHELKIIHYGKRARDHEYNDQGQVTVDKHVEIKGIVMDGIRLERELWDGRFFPVYLHRADHEPVSICPNLYLGHNGTWMLEFSTPAALWLIEQRQHGPKLNNTIFKSNKQVLDSAKDFFGNLPDV